MNEAVASTPGELITSLRVIERALHAIRGERAAHGRTTAAELARLEGRLHALTRRAHECEDGNGFGDLQDLLREVRDWAHLTESHGLREAAEQSRALGRQLAQQSLQGWDVFTADLPETVSAEECFRALLHISSFEMAATGKEGVNPDEAALLTEIREHLRARMTRAIERQAPTDEQRQAWATAMKDSSASLVADLAGLDPTVASRQLEVVRADFEWYLNHVEKEEGKQRRRLKSSRHRLLVEWQERVLQARLETRFGAGFVLFFERLIFWLILAVLGLLVAEMIVEPTGTALLWFIGADTAICGVFLLEFFVKLYYAPLRWLWFRRQFIFMLLPSIPFGLLGLHEADPVRAGRAVRLLRLTRFARYLRVLRPLIRFVRIVGFMTRGLDRLARQYAFLLRTRIILYPTREERIQCDRRRETPLELARQLQEEATERWNHLLLVSEQSLRAELALARLEPLRSAFEQLAGVRPLRLPRLAGDAVGERTADSLIRQLSSMSAAEVNRVLSPSVVGRLARMITLFSYPPVRWLPLISSWVPRVSNHETDAHLVGEVCQNVGIWLGKWHRRWLWFRDLYGAITPSQFVDRVGSLLVRSAMRPAYRLITFGLFLLLTRLVLQLAHLPWLESLETYLFRFLGLPIIVLGSLCLLVVVVGYWMQRLAQEATDFYEESALAQFLQLTELIRTRYIERDTRLFYRRVILPEYRVREGLGKPPSDDEVAELMEMTRAMLVGEHRSHDPHAAFDPVERTVLLYRDSLDGALLADSDTRTTSQLLGNPALRRFRTWSRRFDRKAEKALQRLTLTRQRVLFGGPYFWFLLIVRSISHLTAQRIIEYNRNVLPLEELSRATEDELRRYGTWLESKDVDTSLPFLECKEDAYAYVVTTAFTALHFLDCDPQRDREVGLRFGPEVLDRLYHDRGLLIRRVFGTYPMHHLSKEDRVVDLHALYEYWLGGGRVLLLPLLLLLKGLRHAGQFFGWLWRCLGEIRRREGQLDPDDAADAGFDTAVRKIDRMRGPIVRASMRLRTIVDPEYLGIPLPGLDRTSTPEADMDADVRFLDLEREFIRELEQDRGRAEGDMKRLGELIEGGLLEQVAGRLGKEPGSMRTPTCVRAAAVVYLANYLGVRELLSCEEILRDGFQQAEEDGPLPMRPWPNVGLRWMFWRYRRKHPFANARAKKAAWRAVAHNVNGLANALRTWYHLGEKAREKGLETLTTLLRHPSRITEELVTLRAVQTLALLDVLHYREHVYRLGNYAADGENVQGLLTWGEADRVDDPAGE
jgi:hypothetical protein